MYDIHLIYSMHIEWGKCTVEELYKMIEIKNPEVIFEELDCPDFNEAYNELKPFSLETETITEYLRNNKIKHIPVDTYETTEFDKEKKAYIEKIIYENNEEYRKTLNEQKKLAGQYGFNFLNSIQFYNLSRMIKDQEVLFYQNTDNEKYKNIYNESEEFHDNREYEMISNIYNYSKEHIFEKALFIIGAYHSYRIDRKIKEYQEKEPKLNWKIELIDFKY